MSLSRKRIFNTVKFRIALRYALLFALSSALCVLIAHLTIRRGLLNGFDRQLEAGARQCADAKATLAVQQAQAARAARGVQV